MLFLDILLLAGGSGADRNVELMQISPKQTKVCTSQIVHSIIEEGFPAARLRFARLTLARLGLNDGAKLWVSFKLCFKTNDFYGTY